MATPDGFPKLTDGLNPSISLVLYTHTSRVITETSLQTRQPVSRATCAGSPAAHDDRRRNGGAMIAEIVIGLIEVARGCEKSTRIGLRGIDERLCVFVCDLKQLRKT